MELVRAFIMSRNADGLSPKTIAWHTYSLKTFTEWLEREQRPQHYSEWTSTLLREYVVHLQSTSLSPQSIKTKVTSLLAFTRWLHEEEFTESNIGARLKRPRVPKTIKEPFSNDELHRLLHAAKNDPRDHAILALLIDTGMRANELCTLLVEDVVFNQCLMTIHGKGGRDRIVPFSPQTARLLMKHTTKARHSNSPYVFPTSKAEKLSPNSLLQLVKRIGDRAYVDDVHPHRFRHTAAISYLRNGGDVLSLQRLLGHSSLSMTNHYVNMNTTDLSERHALASPMTNLLRR